VTRGLLTSTGGWVTLEHTVLFPVLFLVVMTFIQLGLMEVGSLTTSHAAVSAARAASVILADDPREYDGVPVGVAAGRRLEDVTEAARLPLTTVTRRPQVTVSFPDRTTFREGDPVRVRVALEFPCDVAVGRWLVCGARPTYRILREATMPYQGAGYTYP
jgi:Flp pilus assembly protein TadG